ncbi:restriction endonuclease [Aliarcobacter butzleri]|uniref:restriction endonuclease n=1 Tax=Aliarcobacter butzleri TaxID=28197 RepID=UPI0021B16B06|nr:restriction endonuclease [Aliarcobacter butzleri]MCT7614904.1 restriction endonuclease [Aliarcobacter butzleri]
MPVLDFKEIPQANTGSGNQDTFELFTRDFLEFLGYKIINEPDRGADGGKDIIVEEIRIGVGGKTTIKWLVSCKHNAHSGNSVSPSIESNIRDRVETHGCQGFIGFYSTLASSGLSTNIQALKKALEYQVFDNEKIENKLLSSPDGLKLAKRYFPKSFETWEVENPKPAKLFLENPSLKCMLCEKELLLHDDYQGLICVWSKTNQDGNEFIKEFTWSCKGQCDNILESKHRSLYPNYEYTNSWKDISDVMIPSVYLKWVMSILNQQKLGTIYDDEAFENMKEFLLQVFHHVSRHLTKKEKERLEILYTIPSWLGGMGN